MGYAPSQYSLRILVVDGHADTTKALSQLFGAIGHEVRAVSTADAALAAAAECDLVITELWLPEGDGLELIAHLKKQYHVPVIAFSSQVYPRNMDAAEHAGAELFLAKPCEPAQLLAAVERFAEELAAAKSTDRTSAGKVLVVEDDPVSLYSLDRTLRHFGMATELAATCAQATAALKNLPEWLVLDLVLPDGDVRPILRRIREEKLPIKVAVVTGVDDPELLRDCAKLHPDAWFTKPVDMPRLVNELSA